MFSGMLQFTQSVLSCLWTGAPCGGSRDTNVKPETMESIFIYSVWIIPYFPYALCAIHHVENSKCLNKWPILAGTLTSIYNVRSGML